MTKKDYQSAEPSAGPERYLEKGQFVVDLYDQRTYLDGRNVPVPPCTFEYLVTLMRCAPEPVSHKRLVADSQGVHLKEIDARDLSRWHIYMLRKAIEADIQAPRFITTIPGYGYRLTT